MRKKGIIKIDETAPRNFNFKPKSPWRRLPWYFLSLILVVVLVVCGGLYYRAQSAINQVITENQSETPKVLQSELSVPSALSMIDDPHQDLINILLLGNGGTNHRRGGLTDVIQVLSIDPIKKEALVFSIPRDLYVKIDGFGYHKINTAYNLGEQTGHGEGGILAKKETEQILNIPIHYYMKIDFPGFVKLVDLLEGVDLCVDQSIHDPDINVQIEFGCQHFDGETALNYVRSRKTTSDFDRSRRQQQVMVAVKDKALKLNFLLNPLKINQVLNILIGHFNTDIKTTELKKLSFSMAGLSSHKISNYVLDNGKDNLLYATTIEEAAVLLPVGDNFQKIHKLVEKKLP